MVTMSISQADEIVWVVQVLARRRGCCEVWRTISRPATYIVASLALDAVDRCQHFKKQVRLLIGVKAALEVDAEITEVSA